MWLSRRMPKRCTMRELMNDEIAMNPAIAAKASGNHGPSP